MKKSLIALAVLAASGAAMAQSSVTLYGVVDTGLTYSKGEESVYGMTHVGGNVNSRLGFRGVEDLGNGLKATFNLEGGMNVDDGTGYLGAGGPKDTSFQFRRTSTVGLAGNFGEVRFGRMLTSSYLAVSRYDAFGDTGAGASLAWNGSQTGYAPRAENAISYTSPSFNGFKFGGEYGFGEQQKAREGRYLGLGATYDNGPLSLGLGGEQLSRDDSALTAGDITAWSLGGSYDLGVAKLLAGYRQSTVDNFAFASTGADAKRKGYMLAVTAPVGPGLVRAAYNRYQDSQTGTADAKADHFAIGYIYSLSKRTSVYGTYAYLKNKNGGTRFSINGDAGLDNGKQQGLQVGMTHAF